MPGNEDPVIINGTLKQWLKYRVIFGKSVEYGDDTDARYAVPGYVVCFVLLLLGGILGALFG